MSRKKCGKQEATVMAFDSPSYAAMAHLVRDPPRLCLRKVTLTVTADGKVTCEVVP